MIVRLQERSGSRPKLVKEGNKVLRIGSQPRIELGNRYVSDFELLPGLRFIRFEYLIERLFLEYQDQALLRYCLQPFTMVSPAMVNERLLNCSAGRCVRTYER